MSTPTAKKIENPLLSRYPSQPAPAAQSSRPSKPLETATHHNVLKTASSSVSSNLPPRRSYDDGLAFPLADLKPSRAVDEASVAASIPKPTYDTSRCWVRVSGIASSDQLNDAMQHLKKFGSIKQRLGNISSTSNIIVVQYSSQFQAMAASASTFIQLTPYFYLAVQRLEDSDPIVQRLMSGNPPSDNIWGAPLIKANEEKGPVMGSVIDETDILLSPPPKKEILQRGFFERLACWLLSITD